MKSIFVSYLLCHILLTYILLFIASAENTLTVSPHEGNKIVTVKTFPSKEDTKRFAEKLKSEGFEVEIREGTTKDNKPFFRVSGKKHPESLKDTLTSSKVMQDEKLSPDKNSELEQEKQQALVILSPRERAEFRNVKKITFSWRKVPAAVGYHVILARDRRFKNIIYENANVADTSYAIENLDYGTYFFKISPISSNGTEGPFSDTLTFIIVPPHL